MAHTPGPWTVQRETVGYDQSLRVIRWLISPDPNVGRGYKPIATIHAGFTCTEEDAQLVAAAPDLLSACKAALDVMGITGNLDDNSLWCPACGGCQRIVRDEADGHLKFEKALTHKPDCARVKVEAAIAKAEKGMEG